jgi:HTH-type transcriptional regulator / antitoxin HigA
LHGSARLILAVLGRVEGTAKGIAASVCRLRSCHPGRSAQPSLQPTALSGRFSTTACADSLPVPERGPRRAAGWASPLGGNLAALALVDRPYFSPSGASLLSHSRCSTIGVTLCGVTTTVVRDVGVRDAHHHSKAIEWVCSETSNSEASASTMVYACKKMRSSKPSQMFELSFHTPIKSADWPYLTSAAITFDWSQLFTIIDKSCIFEQFLPMPSIVKGNGRNNHMTTHDLQHVNQVWPSLAPYLFVPHTEREYQRLVSILDSLIDTVGEDEHHALASLMEIVGILIEKYEDEHVPEITNI